MCIQFRTVKTLIGFQTDVMSHVNACHPNTHSAPPVLTRMTAPKNGLRN